MNAKQLLETTPETLAQKQLQAVNDVVLAKLDRIKDLIIARKYQKVRDLLGSSPAGDGHGCDNEYIRFDEELGNNVDDMADVCDLMERLNKTINANKEI